MIHYIDEIQDLEGKLILLRLDLNVPVEQGEITDTYRLDAIIDTIDFLRGTKARTIIVGHIEGNDSTSLIPVWKYLNGFFPVHFSETYFTPEAIDKVIHMEEGDVLLFENLRTNPGEKENDLHFAKKLAQMADIYVNDAFAVSHRKHASIVGVPQFLPHYGGLLMRKEIEHLSEAFHPEHPFLFIIGGAKFETKLPLIQKYLQIADHVFVGGALTNNIYKEKGYEIGTSRISDGDFGIKEVLNNPKLILPVDVTSACDGEMPEFKTPDQIQKNSCIMDAGPQTVNQIKKLLRGAKTIVWNGPLGNFEKGFGDKTEQLAEIIAEATKKGARSIVGGGDTLASIKKLGINDSFTFVSTGGGAMLDFLANETLPGIEALE